MLFMLDETTTTGVKVLGFSALQIAVPRIKLSTLGFTKLLLHTELMMVGESSPTQNFLVRIDCRLLQNHTRTTSRWMLSLVAMAVIALESGCGSIWNNLVNSSIVSGLNDVRRLRFLPYSQVSAGGSSPTLVTPFIL